MERGLYLCFKSNSVMKIKLIVVGKTTEKYLKTGIDKYLTKINRFTNFKIVELPEIKFNKKASIEVTKAKEQDLILKNIDCPNVILLDETGKLMNSTEFAHWIQKFLNSGNKCLNFVIGGPYGFSKNLKEKYPKLSLSPMTFSHQLVRLIFVEQLYRAFTIINSQPYHH